jgi:hypothetical protein
MIRQPRSQRQKTGTPSAGQVHHIANLLRRYYAPASLMPPPGLTRGSTGNRNVAITSDAAPNYTPNDQATIRLVNGVAIWRFSTAFKNPPISKATAVGVLLDGGGNPVANEIYAQGIGTRTGVIFHSTDTSDTRLIMVHAAGNPD